MSRILRRWLPVGLLLVLTVYLHAQSNEDSAKAQEDFAAATATAHARTSLFVVGSKPFAIHATVLSTLAVHVTGKGTYENRWVDSQHWQRTIRFPDFQQSEMRNDSGHSWTDGSNDAMPLRIAEMLRVVVLHVPGSNTASRVPVSETSIAGDHGEPINCYAVTRPTPFDGFALRYRWCFDQGTGLLISEDMPLNTHIVYSNYIAFQGKHEFTHVRVTSGSLPVLDLEIQYATLDPHALDGAAPEAFMHRTKSAGSTPNPEELRKGSVEYRFNPFLPPGTPDAAKNSPVLLHFYVGADNTLLDASVEDAPTEALAKAALEAAPRFTFTPLMVDGTRVNNHIFQSVWFRSGADDAPSEAKSGGVYRSDEPSFAFRYPADFERVPQGELEEDMRNGSAPHHPGAKPGEECTTVLFRAQRLRRDNGRVDFLTMYELLPSCVFGLLDKGALENIVANAAGTVVAQWTEGSVSKPKSYLVKGRRIFGTVSLSGKTRDDESMRALVAATNIRGHVLIWTILGPSEDITQTLESCTLQTGEETELSLPTVHLTP